MLHRHALGIVLVTVLTGSIVSAGPTVLLHDDFDGPSLNTALWSVNFSSTAGDQPQIVQHDGVASIFNRAYLIPRTSFDPVALGGIRIRGRATIPVDEILNIVTRTTAIPGPSFGEQTDGLAFGAWNWSLTDEGVITIQQAVFPDVTRLASHYFDFSRDDNYDFDVTDDGRHVAFNITQVSDPSHSVQISTDTEYQSNANLVAFFSREFGAGVDLQYVTIESLGNDAATVPLPSAVWTALTACGFLGGCSILAKRIKGRFAF